MPYDPLNFANKPNDLENTPVDKYALQMADEELRQTQGLVNESTKSADNIKQQEQQVKVNQANKDKKAQDLDKESSALDIGQGVQQAFRGAVEAPTALVGGFIDFAEDIGRKTGAKWLDLDDRIEPQNTTEYGKALRSIISVVGPNLVAMAATRKFFGGWAKDWPGISNLTKLNKPIKAGLTLAADAGIGVGIDQISRTAEDDNLSGTLKKEFPAAFGWIPDNLATLDTDSPDVKRKKNTWEGFGMGAALDGLGYLAKAIKAVRGAQTGTKIIPLDETAKASVAKEAESLKPITGDPAVDSVIRNVEARNNHETASVLDEFNRNPNPEAPTPRMNPDLFSKEETGIHGIRPNAVRRAMVDAGRIHKNIDSVDGVLENIVTEPALREGLDAALEGKRTVVAGIATGIRESGKFKAVTQLGKEVDPRTMDEGMLAMYKQIIDPDNKIDDLADVFIDEKFINNNFKVGGKGIEQITDRAYTTAMLSIKRLMDDYMGVEAAKASALAVNSTAGEVVGLSSGVKILGNEVNTAEVQQRILDKVEFLLNETWVNSYASGMALRNKKIWQRATNIFDMGRFAKEANADISEKFAQKAAQNKEFVDNLRQISRDNPEYLKPLIEAYDLTNGNVRTINALNKWFNKHLNPAGLITKGIIDGEPNIPNYVQQGIWSTIYNSVLSGTATFTSAWVGNATMLINKPFASLLGAGADPELIKRVWVKYGAVGDSFQKAAEYARIQTKKIFDDPVKYGAIDRPDLALMEEDRWMVLENVAKAREANGEAGPMFMYNMAKALRDLNNWSGIRYSANLMGSGDAFSRAFVASADARARAYDQLLDEGKDITKETLKEASERIYREMFDEDGVIRGEAVDFQAKEVAMSLDGPASQAVSGLVKVMPILKPFILFPRTTGNMLAMGVKHTPLSLFMREGQIAAMPSRATPEDIAEFMNGRGITTYTHADFLEAASEVRGRVALGAIAMYGANQLLLQGRLTGNPPADKERRSAMEKAMGGAYWNSIKGLDGNWYSHTAFQPYSSILAAAADISNIFWTNPNQAITEELLQKLTYVVGLNAANKSWTQGIAQFMDLLSGDMGAINRTIASLGNAMIPYAGLRGQVSRIYDPALREVENDIGQYMRNRNGWMDIFDPKSKLPYARDMFDGKILNNHNLLTRLLNASTPFKLNPDKITPGRQLLIDSGFDAVPAITKYSGSPDLYTNDQRSKIAAYMGIYGDIDKQLDELANKKWVKDEMTFIIKSRREGLTSKQFDTSQGNVHRAIRQILERAKNFGEQKMLNETPEIRTTVFDKRKREMQVRTGQYDQVINLPNGK